MFFQFIAALTLVSFAFTFILMAVGIPFYLLVGLLSRTDDTRTWPDLVNHCIISITYAAIIAILSMMYASQESVQYPWIYVGCGFIATFTALARNVQKATREGDEVLEIARMTGLLVGILAYPVVSAWPWLVTFIPGSKAFFTAVFTFADWLTGFLVVRIILWLAVLSYVIGSGFMALFVAFGLFYMLRRGMRRLLGVRDAA